MADALFAALKYGHISGWIYWLMSGNHTASEVLMLGGVPDKPYYASKQFFRYIRPGAKGIGAESDDAEVAVVGFHHEQKRTLTLVLLNWSSTSKSVTLSGTNMPQFTAYRTSSTLDCANVGTVSGTITLPAGSITTLFGSNYDPGVGVSAARARAAVGAGGRQAAIFGLDGRLVSRLSTVQADAGGALSWDSRQGNASRGVYCVRLGDRSWAGAPVKAVLGR